MCVESDVICCMCMLLERRNLQCCREKFELSMTSHRPILSSTHVDPKSMLLVGYLKLEFTTERRRQFIASTLNQTGHQNCGVTLFLFHRVFFHRDLFHRVLVCLKHTVACLARLCLVCLLFIWKVSLPLRSLLAIASNLVIWY